MFILGQLSVKPTKKAKSQQHRQVHQVYPKKKSFHFMLNQMMTRWTREEERELKHRKEVQPPRPSSLSRSYGSNLPTSCTYILKRLKANASNSEAFISVLVSFWCSSYTSCFRVYSCSYHFKSIQILGSDVTKPDLCIVTLAVEFEFLSRKKFLLTILDWLFQMPEFRPQAPISDAPAGARTGSSTPSGSTSMRRRRRDGASPEKVTPGE